MKTSSSPRPVAAVAVAPPPTQPQQQQQPTAVATTTTTNTTTTTTTAPAVTVARKRGRRRQQAIPDQPSGLNRVFIWDLDGSLVRSDTIAGSLDATEPSVLASVTDKLSELVKRLKELTMNFCDEHLFLGDLESSDQMHIDDVPCDDVTVASKIKLNDHPLPPAAEAAAAVAVDHHHQRSPQQHTHTIQHQQNQIHHHHQHQQHHHQQQQQQQQQQQRPESNLTTTSRPALANHQTQEHADVLAAATHPLGYQLAHDSIGGGETAAYGMYSVQPTEEASFHQLTGVASNAIPPPAAIDSGYPTEALWMEANHHHHNHHHSSHHSHVHMVAAEAVGYGHGANAAHNYPSLQHHSDQPAQPHATFYNDVNHQHQHHQQQPQHHHQQPLHHHHPLHPAAAAAATVAVDHHHQLSSQQHTHTIQHQQNQIHHHHQQQQQHHQQQQQRSESNSTTTSRPALANHQTQEHADVLAAATHPLGYQLAHDSISGGETAAYGMYSVQPTEEASFHQLTGVASNAIPQPAAIDSSYSTEALWMEANHHHHHHHHSSHHSHVHMVAAEAVGYGHGATAAANAAHNYPSLQHHSDQPAQPHATFYNDVNHQHQHQHLHHQHHHQQPLHHHHPLHPAAAAAAAVAVDHHHQLSSQQHTHTIQHQQNQIHHHHQQQQQQHHQLHLNLNSHHQHQHHHHHLSHIHQHQLDLQQAQSNPIQTQTDHDIQQSQPLNQPQQHHHHQQQQQHHQQPQQQQQQQQQQPQPQPQQQQQRPEPESNSTATTLKPVLNHHKQMTHRLSMRFHRIKTVYNLNRASFKSSSSDQDDDNNNNNTEATTQIISGDLQEILAEIDHFTLDWRRRAIDCLRLISGLPYCTNIIITKLPLVVAFGHLVCLGLGQFFEVDQVYSASKTNKEACIRRIRKRFGAANRCTYIIIGDKDDVELAKRLDFPTWPMSHSHGHRQLLQLYTALKEGLLV